MTTSSGDVEHWSKFAAEWIDWARAPDDAFWAYRDSLLAFIGKGRGLALDVGCGEGRVSRVLRECGFCVVATDPVPALLAAAAERDSARSYVAAPATRLPLADRTFDLVMAYNVLMDLDDLKSAVREMRRVLRPSGTLIASIVHPFTDRGRFAGAEVDAPFVVKGNYFDRERFQGEETRGGLRMHFAGWSLPLQAYVETMAEAGLVVTAMREPVPKLTGDNPQMVRWQRFPLFLWLKATPRASPEESC